MLSLEIPRTLQYYVVEQQIHLYEEITSPFIHTLVCMTYAAIRLQKLSRM